MKTRHVRIDRSFDHLALRVDHPGLEQGRAEGRRASGIFEEMHGGVAGARGAEHQDLAAEPDQFFEGRAPAGGDPAALMIPDQLFRQRSANGHGVGRRQRPARSGIPDRKSVV